LIDHGWLIFYKTSIALLKYYKQKLLSHTSFESIIGQIKQVRPGCDHLLIMQSNHASAVRRLTTTQGNEYSMQSMTSLLDLSITDLEASAKFDAKFEKIWTSILQIANGFQWEGTASQHI
jgi:hypothetical protein